MPIYFPWNGLPAGVKPLGLQTLQSGEAVGIQPPSALTYIAQQVGQMGDSFASAGRVVATSYTITGVGDEGVKLNAAMSDAAAQGKVLVIPAGMTITSSVQIVVPSNLDIEAYEAVLKNAMPSTSARLLVFSGANNRVSGLTVDGDKAGYFSRGGADTEQRHNIVLLSANNIRLIDVDTINAQGDGLYIGDDTAPSTNIKITRMNGLNNARNGMAIISVYCLTCSDSYFGGQAGKHPQAGLDIEPNTNTTRVEDIVFSNTHFVGNVGAVMVSLRDAPTVPQRGFTFNACSYNGSTDATFSGSGLRVHNGRGVRVFGGEARYNAMRGITLTGMYGEDNVFLGVNISDNGLEGIGCGSGAAAQKNLRVAFCTIKDNSKTTPGALDGIYLSGVAGAELAFNTYGGSSHRFHVRTEGGTTDVLSILETFSSAATSGNVSDTANAIWTLGPKSTLYRLASAAAEKGFAAKIIGESFDRFFINADGDMRWGDGTVAPDTRLYRSAADTLRTNDALTVDKVLTVAQSAVLTASDGNGYIEMREQAADPAAPVANQGRLFMRDSGSGKSQLCVRFNSGVVQIIATEP